MVTSKFFDKFNKSVLKNWILSVVVIVLSSVIIVQTIEIGIMAKDKEFTVLPPVVNTAFTVQGNHYSKGYLIDMGNFISQTVLNVNPKNYESQINLFMQFVNPKDFDSIRLDLLKDYKTLSQLQISQVFYPLSINAGKNVLRVKGNLMRVIGAKSTSEEKTFIIKYKIVNGEFYVNSIGFAKKAF